MPTPHSADNGSSMASVPAGRPVSERKGHRSPREKRRPASGFTIIELVVVLAIVGVLAGVAAPAVMNMVRDNSIVSASNLLAASLNYARNQALIQHATVTLCKSSNGTSCASSNGYEKGWMVFVDANANGAYDTGETILKKVTLNSNNKITINGTPSSAPGIALSVGFTPLGMVNGANATNSGSAYFVLCDDRLWANSGQYARIIAISTTGRISTAQGTKQSDIGLTGSAQATTCSPT